MKVLYKNYLKTGGAVHASLKKNVYLKAEGVYIKVRLKVLNLAVFNGLKVGGSMSNIVRSVKTSSP